MPTPTFRPREGPNPPPSHGPQIMNAIALMEADKFDQAISVLRRVLATDAANGHAHRVLSNVLLLKLDRRPALYHAQLALKHAPAGDAEFLYVLGRQMRQVTEGEEVASVFERAVTIDKAHVGAWIGLSEALLFCQMFHAAVAAAERGLAHHPYSAELLMNKALGLENMGRADEALALLTQAAHGPHAGHLSINGAVAAMTNYAYHVTPRQNFEAHRLFGQLLARATPPYGVAPTLAGRAEVHPGGRPPRLRVGFESPDLRDHAVARFFEPLLRNLDKSRFHTICYSTTLDPDEVTKRLRPLASRFVECPMITDHALLDTIRADKLDIYVDLCGLMAGQRLAVLYLKPAPITVSWLGYPGTLGVPKVDYRIVDERTDPFPTGPLPSSPLPPGLLPRSPFRATDPYNAQELATEKLVRLPECFICFRPPDADPGVAHPAGHARAHSGPVFGCFNMAKKIGDPLLALWARLLNAVPDSRLIIKNYALRSASVRDTFTTRLEALGIATRTTIEPPNQYSRDHLARYLDIDIALDTFPYCGTTTTCEALFMGVPVVSLVGRSHQARVGFSLLCTIGHPDWCADSEDEYIEIAKRLAADLPALATGRPALRQALLNSPLCDGPGFARRFEHALDSIWAEKTAKPA